MKVLLTGFVGYGPHKTNPSEDLVRLLEAKYKNIDIHVFSGYKDIDTNLEKVIAHSSPDVVIMFGLASRTPYVRLERAATPPQRVVGEEQYQSSLPLPRIYEALLDIGVEVQYSNSAGTFWCNYIFYKAGQLHEKYDFNFGFIHIPYTADYKKKYGKELDLLLFGETILQSTINNEPDLYRKQRHG